ncbi:hypothetical protein F4677DRAFT_410509 [Hypoxylon crocopeplum]|nr:hypothetical protein F4677DRAFT_410509 [Hypoxylon crocopeplum]
MDTYVSLLLCLGCYYFLIPTVIWRTATCFNPLVDPTRWSPVPRSLKYRLLNHIMVLASSAFQIWFWAKRVGYDYPSDCEAFGFLFSKQPMGSAGLRVANIVAQTIVLWIAFLAPILAPFYTAVVFVRIVYKFLSPDIAERSLDPIEEPSTFHVDHSFSIDGFYGKAARGIKAMRVGSTA